MKKHINKIFLISLLIATCLQLGVALSTVDTHLGRVEGKPSGLTVEHIRVKIIDSRPEFSWRLPTEAIIQKSYQILVASSKALMDQQTGDVWDSGEVISRQSTDIELAGGELKENTRYFWKVRYRDSKGQLSAYSDEQEFSTGEFGEKLTSHNYFQIESITPVASKQLSDGTYFIDFGKAAFEDL